MRTIKAIIAVATLIGVMALTPTLGGDAEAASSGMWKIPVIFSDGTSEGVLYVGGSNSCTDGYDALEEMYARLGGYVVGYFYHPEWGRRSAPGGSDYYMADIRSLSAPQSWTMYVRGVRTGGDITVTWPIGEAADTLACEGIELSFSDPNTGASVPMEDGTSYTYYNASRTYRQFKVTAKQGEAIDKLAAPRGLASNPGQGVVSLRWSDSDEAEGYVVYRGIGSGPLSRISGETPLTDDDGDGNVHFVDKSVDKGKRSGPVTYTYAVAGISGMGCEGETATIRVRR